MRKLLLLITALLTLGVSGAWAQAITVKIVDGTNAPFDTYGTRNNSATPNTLTTNAASGLAGVVLSAPVIDRSNGWWSTYCLALCPSATQTAETVTFTAPEGYLLLSVNMTAQANSSNYPYDVVFNGSTTTVTGASAQTFSASNILSPSFSFTINHTAASFNSSSKWFAVKSLTLQLVKIVTNTSQIDANKSYVVKCDRSAWAVANNGTALSTIGELNLALSIPDAKQRFAFVTPDNGANYYYLYSVNAGKFLHAESNAGNGGSWVYGGSADKVYFADASSYKANTWRVYLEGENKNINVGGSNQVTIDSWATADAGCAYYLIEAADVDGDALVERLKGPISVTWKVVSEANGSAVATGTSDAYRTEALALPSDLARPFCTYEYFTDAACTQAITSFPSDYSGTGTETVYAKYTFSAPFTVSETFNTATWYYMKIRTSKYVVYSDAAPYACTTTKEDGKKGMWAFMGDPYAGIQVVNRYAGSGYYLQATATQPSMTTTATNWTIGNNDGNFTLYESSVGYMNEAGSAGYLKYWNSSNGATDDGSTFRVEAAPTDVEALANLLATYEIAAANLDKPGFPTSAAYTTFRNTIEGFASLEAWDEGIDAALTAVKASVVYPNGTYYIKNRNTGCYAFITDDGELVPRIKIDNTVSHANNNYLWTVTSDKSAGTCNIVSSLYSNVPFAKGDNTYANITSSNRTVITTLSTELFSSNNGTSGGFYLNGAHNNNTYATAGNGNSHVVSWNNQDSKGSQWIFEPADLGTAYTVTVEGLNDGGEDAVTLSDGTIVNLGTGTVYLSEIPTTSNITQNEVSGYSILDGSIVVDGTTVTVTYSPSYDVLIANYWNDNNIAVKLANAGQYGYPATDNEYTVALNGVATDIAGGSYEGNATNYNNLRTWYAGFLAADKVKPADGTFIQIRSNLGANACLKAVAAGARMTFTTTEDKNTIFLFSGGKLIAYTHGIAVNNVREIGTVGGAASTFSFVNAVNGGVGLSLAATYDGNTNYLYSTGVDGSNADRNTYSSGWVDNNTFTIEAVTTLPVTITAAGYATLFAPVALTIPTGVTAYAAADEGDYLTLTAIEGGVIPANTGVILKGDANTYNFDITTGGRVDSNALTGSVAAISRPSGSYILATGTSGVGFYPDGAQTIPGFKAYLPASTGSGVKAFRFGTEDAIKGIFGENENSEWYDLSGRRVSQPTRGLYIVNGKKVVIK